MLTLRTMPNRCKNRKGSAIYYFSDEQKRVAVETRDHFNELLEEAGRSPITTEIAPAPEYYFAEEYRKYRIISKLGSALSTQLFPR